ncbi:MULTISPECIES: DoxX family protein [Nocardia]|uniref:DoxX family protein n=1 Tax=Nocardia TaxID=1817 RepID=UPI000BF108F4|nr:MULTISPECIES: DoxX family protein [Nocardia]MBF6185202.1 DoxX family protein [Nocardia farcinica]MBF6248048.1 DoxX family protein [Nocardia elegans]MBF6311038.1 DoxX family protein [Nocardia farcinica]MBF6360665.1 DoxX family protein [Nocardia farcinica]MBF6407657.1 DoxX family protein [Nocardia farcinica]
MTTTTGNTASTALTPARANPGVDVGLLILRLAVGLTMAAHGSQKLLGWFDGPGLDGTEAMLSSMGYPSPQIFAVITAVTETFGGLALALGLLTPLAAAAILGTMVNAISVKWGGGFWAPKGIEYELLLALGATTLAFTGAGRISVDAAVPALRYPRLASGLGFVILGLVVAGVVLLIRN